MKIGVIVPIHNRAKYLEDCLWSLEHVKLPKDSVILLINDASTDQQSIHLFNIFNHPTALIQRDISQTNLGIRGALLHGYETLFGMFKCDLVINFDSDAIIKPNAVTELIKHYIPGTLLTGFHSTTKNSNGTERHKIIYESETLYLKQSVGGINFCIDKTTYESFIKPALEKVGNFDHNSCINAGGAYCLKESVVQHIGFESSMNHNEQPDVADDFYYWHLPQVTLIGVDNQVDRLIKAKEKCIAFIKFGEIVLLHPPIYSKESYSEFCIRELYKHVKTSHMLIFQHDGFVNNWKAWDNDWLQYDYIGAPWHYMDGMAVGNGGFSLRSKRLMEIVATDPHIKITHPEDHHICRTYRPYLEIKYGIKFAPADVAEKFSFEGYLQPSKILKDQFGCHGNRIRLTPQPPLNTQKYVVNQFRGLGDILFLVPLIRALVREGNKVIWPIDPEYISIAKHFPDLNMVNMREVKVDYSSRQRINTNYGQLLPYRFAIENLGLSMEYCMTAKYTMYGHDWKMWRELTWARDYVSEKKLSELVGANGEYILVNRYFGAASDGRQITPELPNGVKVIEMRTLPGFTLLDWCGVIENASEIHSANTSLLYVLEMMDLKMPIHFYKRGLWGEKGYEHTQMLYTKNYILH